MNAAMNGVVFLFCATCIGLFMGLTAWAMTGGSVLAGVAAGFALPVAYLLCEGYGARRARRLADEKRRRDFGPGGAWQAGGGGAAGGRRAPRRRRR